MRGIRGFMALRGTRGSAPVRGRRGLVPVSAIVICALLVSTALIKASWIEDGIPVCVETGCQSDSRAISDGAGGAIVAWVDTRSGGSDIYVQRIDAAGTALWTEGGVPVCTIPEYSLYVDIASDGAGGVILVWEDDRYEYMGVYAQRVDSTGTVRWMTDGVEVSLWQMYSAPPIITADGSGGAIIAWTNGAGVPGSENIYAQRIDATGARLWSLDGIVVCWADNTQTVSAIVSDGSGGAIVTWEDNRDSDMDIYAQRIDSTGATLWTEDGVAVCTDERDQHYPQIASDGAEGAIVSWADELPLYCIYVQRVDSTGALHWTEGSVAVSPAHFDQGLYHDIIGDGAEGAIVTWYEDRDYDWDVFAQRVDSAGVLQWGAYGTDVCTAYTNQINPQITPDGAGGGIIVWEDERNGALDIYAQRVDAEGAVQWETDGIPVCTASDDQHLPHIVSDGIGWGAIAAWDDEREGACDVYAAYLSGPPNPDMSIVLPWDWYGHALVVPGADTGTDSVIVIVRDELGAPIRTAEVEIDISSCSGLCIDSPNGLSASADDYGTAILNPRVGGCCECDVLVLANGIEIRSYPHINSPDWDGTWADGVVGNQDIAYIYITWGTADQCADYDGNGTVDMTDLAIASECLHATNDVTCPYYACGVAPTGANFGTVMTGTVHDTAFVIKNIGGGALAGTVSESCAWCSILSGGGWYSLSSGDSVVVSLRCTPVDTGSNVCTVQTGDETCSDFTCGCYAIDTIPPPAPTGFGVAYNAGSSNRLTWDESPADDIDHFSVYRAGRPELSLPEPIDTAWAPVHSSPDTFWVDDVPDAWKYRYRLTAVDHAGNESDLTYPETVTGGETAPPPARFALYQNVPNPFNPTTTIRFDVPYTTTARLAVYDITGRLVRVLADGPVDPGQVRVTWDGRDARGIPVASGVYFYRLTAPRFSESRKMIFLR